MNLLRKGLSLAALVLFGLLSVPAHADGLNVINPDFTQAGPMTQSEACSTGTCSWNQTAPTGWVLTGGGGSEVGFFSSLPSGSDTNAFLNIGSLSQDLGIQFQPDTTYTFSVYMGLRNPNPIDQGGYSAGAILGTTFSLNFTAGGDIVATLNGSNADFTPGTFQLETLSFTTGDVAPTGDLGLLIQSNGVQTEISSDAVTAATPEPGTLVLFGSGMLAFAGIMRRKLLKKGVAVAALLLLSAITVPLAHADGFNYAVLGGAGVTNTGSSVINGNVGGSVGTPAVTGFPPGIVNFPYLLSTAPGVVFTTDANALSAALGATSNFDISGFDLGGMELNPGVYTFDSSAQLTGTLILNAQGNPNANFIFQIGSSLTTASNSVVEVINAGPDGLFGGSITWAVTSSATLGTDTAFLGQIYSYAGDTLTTGASIGCGGVTSLDGSVTLDTNNVDIAADCQVVHVNGVGGVIGLQNQGGTSPTPEPSTFVLIAIGFGILLIKKALL